MPTIETIKQKVEEKGYTFISLKENGQNPKITMTCSNSHEFQRGYMAIKNITECPKCAKSEKLTAIENEFKAVGYKLITTEYTSLRNKLDYECDKGHITSVFYGNFKKGCRCNKCSKNSKKSHEFIKEEFEKVGYKLLSTEYVKAINKLDYECDKGHVTQISYNDLQQGTRCNICHRSVWKFDEIIELYGNRNYELLSEEGDYKDITSVLKFRCDKGHVNEMPMSSISNGRTCSICTKNKKLTIEFVEEEFKKRGLTLLDTEYTNAKTYMKFICDKNNHRYQTTYDDLNQGGGCARCKGKGKLTLQNIQDAFAKEGYTLLSKTYINAHKNLKFRCDEGHIAEITYTHFKSSNRRCPTCSESNGARAVRQFLEECDDVTEYTPEKRILECKDIRPLPFDFHAMIDDIEFLIEYDGRQHFIAVEYFGGDKALKTQRKRDKIKTTYCRQNNIPLIRISYKHLKNVSTILDEYVDKLKLEPDLMFFTDDDIYAHLQ